MNKTELWKKIKKFFTIESIANYDFYCVCGNHYEGQEVEYYIKHTNQTGHKTRVKVNKTTNHISVKYG